MHPFKTLLIPYYSKEMLTASPAFATLGIIAGIALLAFFLYLWKQNH